RFAELAKTDNSSLVRLYLASALQRVQPEKRWQPLGALLQRAEDRDDHNLPLMLWYAFEPAVPTNIDRAIDLASKSQLPQILSYTIQRISAMDSEASGIALQGLQKRMEKMNHSRENHEILSLIKKEFEKD